MKELELRLNRTTSEAYGIRYKPLGGITEYKLATQSIDADLFLGTDNLSLAEINKGDARIKYRS